VRSTTHLTSVQINLNTPKFRYGWGRGLKYCIKAEGAGNWLQQQGEGIQARTMSTGPVQDKVWAQRAGIGWIAKNGNVITREYGSWVFWAKF